MSRLLACLLLAICIAAAFGLPSEQDKRRRWKTTTTVPKPDIPDGLDLAHVNIVWRHGDRSPTAPMQGDRVTEAMWTFGGGGWGQLSPIGMEQHFNFGKKLFARYAANNKYLSETYKSNEIYIHCTDFNRTLMSATSNLVGMYSQSKAQAGRDYPAIPGWPTMFVPIPVHADMAGRDHIGDPSFKCPRQNDLLVLLHRTNDYALANGPDAQGVFAYLRNATGASASDINFDNVNKISDNINIERVHFPHNISTWYPYYTQEISDKLAAMNAKATQLQEGILVDNIVNGVDLTQEIRTVRGGPLINDIMAKARGVLQCRLRDTYGQTNGCKDSDTFFRNLKYHVISAHDSTVNALLTVLGAKMSVFQANPLYTAAVLTEFFVDTRNNGTDLVFRTLYHDDENSDFRVITPFVDGCNGDFCPIAALQQIANNFAPPGGIEQLCLQRIPL